MASKRLKTYRSKRDFHRTSEPSGARRRRRSKKPSFVIQKHDASSLHYDFRLEADGVLLSWAVPKGPSTDPREKRLAVRTEDHPLDYAEFEGVIPEGEYGGGTVMVWDRGTYRNLKKDERDEEVPVARCADGGHVLVWLEGEKLRGGYALQRFRKRGGKEQWLLIKRKDDAADARRNPVSTQTKSAASGRTMRQIEREEST